MQGKLVASVATNRRLTAALRPPLGGLRGAKPPQLERGDLGGGSPQTQGNDTLLD